MAQVRVANVSAVVGQPRVRVAAVQAWLPAAGNVRLAGVVAESSAGPQVRLAGVQAAVGATGSSGQVRLAAALASAVGPLVRVAHIDAASFDGSFSLPRITANAGADTSARPFDTVSVDASASANLDGPVLYSWAQTAGAPVVLSSPGTASPTFEAPATVTGTTVALTLTATDGTGATRTDTVSVDVAAHNLFHMDAGGPVPLQVRPA